MNFPRRARTVISSSTLETLAATSDFPLKSAASWEQRQTQLLVLPPQTPGWRGEAGVGRGTRHPGTEHPAPTPSRCSSAPTGTVPSASRPHSEGFTTALASSTISKGRWITHTSKERRTESKQRRMPFKLSDCGESPGAAARDDRTRRRPQGRSSRQLFACSSTEVGEQLGGTATSFSPFQPSHSRTPSIVPQCWSGAPRRSGAPHTSRQRSPDPPCQRQLGGDSLL